MATDLYLKNAIVEVWNGTTAQQFSLKDAARGVTPGATLFEGSKNTSPKSLRALTTTIGTGAGVAETVTTVAGPTAGIFLTNTNLEHIIWMSAPIAADFTLSGTVTFALCGSESDMSANATWRVALYRVDEQGALILISNSLLVTELTVTTITRNTWTATPTSTAMKKGDRLAVLVMADDSSTMGTGFTVTMQHDGAAASVADSKVSLTETVTFLTADPSGTTYWLRDTASPIDPGAATEKALSTTQGAGTATAVHTTIAGPLTFPGDQWTVSAGGADVEWYTPSLNAFTLGGLVQVLLGQNSDYLERAIVTPFDCLTIELAVVDANGSNPVVWSRSYTTFLSITDFTSRYCSGADLAVGQGKRLRLRFFSDDTRPFGNLVAGTNRTIRYDGTATYASKLVFTQTITEVPLVVPFPQPYTARRMALR